jgi:hypothetical protein
MKVKVNLVESLPLDCFKGLLQKYRDFISCYRELKINSITGKKSQFEITELNPPIICGFEKEENYSFGVFPISRSCFTITSIDMVVNDSLDVVDIYLEINILNTERGKLLSEILEDVEFRTCKSYKYEKVHEVYGFYATSSSMETS